ncbi:NAD(P)H-dependent oxidoreductase subunit E [Aquabacterium sp. J223]|uniref:NAD(P)H-dependent oxidoreductase subunit E n=1 Tax=Aquabacterium sp. J223 TaxID=2898431 RepID=UPI0021AE0B4F|nr:NAD(P)H-dependent oxidoreductase subunit E [Aquabacterium sp. J223]UUX97195.1 NAD(P)H-dependent oxidoreductase subunit E [Aquabacterium sp. J223]
MPSTAYDHPGPLAPDELLPQAGARSTPPATLPPAWADAVAAVIAERRHLDGALLPILHGVQDALGHVPADAVPMIAKAVNRSRAEVHGVITYYHHFRQTPARAHVLQVCRAESCRTMGGEALLAQAEALGREHGCTVEPIYCLGLCAQSPAVLLDDRPQARVTPAKLARLMASLKEAT